MDFFIPHSTDKKQAEGVYQDFLTHCVYDVAHPTARLCHVEFDNDGEYFEASVGNPIARWPEGAGDVLAIIETQRCLYIFTIDRGGRSGTPIYASEIRAKNRIFFDDYPKD